MEGMRYMNEYERLINYLNSVINDITDRRSKIEEKNVNNSIVKSSLSNIINLIVNHKLELIDIDELGRLLDGLISECKEVGIETMTPEELAIMEGYERR